MGWLMLGLAGEETGMPAGRALHIAEALCPDDDDVPTVDEVRTAFPEPLHVGQTADDEPVTLRALAAGERPDKPEPPDDDKPERPERPQRPEPEPEQADTADDGEDDEDDDGEPKQAPQRRPRAKKE